ncbi:HlyD family secretion protein [Sulfuritortus calidifontis]|uniref:HlyD family secretion protein n=1 Tax=Sulfuritortus calidifontis TaxID=1914471 RepID=A0A4R3JPG5_9PROT|nr:efflux RND transporter periplasmic adaptor subunit [Sulfuritortus calidifontis]TCS68554.1 HlyD family secretion protein [Sulfuritortus calidifontis]
MKLRLRPAYLLGALAVLAAAGFLFGAVAGKPVTVAIAREGPLIETVVATGRVITPARIALGPVFTATVSQVQVAEGDRVQAGQPLATLDAAERRAALEQAAKALQEADARIEQLERVGRPVADQALIQAEAALDLASKEFERTRRLVEAGFYNQAQLDIARRNLDNARAGREAAAAQAHSNQPNGADTRLARARQAQARAALDLARARLNDTVLRAPVEALVLRKMVEPGDVVTQGKVLFELAAAGETQIELQIDEKNLGRLRPGQMAQVVADAYPGQPFPAELFFIAPAVDAQKGSVQVKLRVTRVPAFLKPDMTVSAEIEVGRRERALILPSQAVRDAAGAQPWVLVAEAGRAVRRPVRLGLRGTGQVEVAEGLPAGAAVILPVSGVHAGQRVRLVE